MSLEQALAWLLGGGLGVIAFALLVYLEPRWPWFRTLAFDAKRAVSCAFAGLVGIVGGALALLLSIWMGYHPPPGSKQEWVALLMALAIGSAMISQQGHGISQQKKIEAAARGDSP